VTRAGGRERKPPLALRYEAQRQKQLRDIRNGEAWLKPGSSVRLIHFQSGPALNSD